MTNPHRMLVLCERCGDVRRAEVHQSTGRLMSKYLDLAGPYKITVIKCAKCSVLIGQLYEPAPEKEPDNG